MLTNDKIIDMVVDETVKKIGADYSVKSITNDKIGELSTEIFDALKKKHIKELTARHKELLAEENRLTKLASKLASKLALIRNELLNIEETLHHYSRGGTK